MKILKPRHRSFPIIALGGVLASVAIYSLYSMPSRTAAGGESTTEIPDSIAPSPLKNVFSTSPHSEQLAPPPNNASADQEIDTPFSAEEIQSRLKNYFDRFLSDPSFSDAEQRAFASRVVASIEADPKAKRAVADYLGKMPDGMLRDLMGNMLLLNATGREVLVTEANRVWDTKDTSLYRDMYMTYANIPGAAPPGMMADAISSLSDRGSAYPSASALNFVGTLEQDTSIHGAALRQSAISQMDSLISSNGDDTVRAIAAQKVYRLSSPESAADAAINYVSRGPTTPLVMETLNSVRSGDVELTPTLRSTLAAAVSRPQASQDEKQSFRALTAAPGL
ncbi:hypothetical protein FHY30_000489 [Xanthomonas arboricola]|uniref:hypothetical protein n=1 Tax=Xanthomonas campestris TaxID=339 RepID=UPI0023E9E79E|nr:hypothetical protein [Xanthomonas campestris]